MLVSPFRLPSWPTTVEHGIRDGSRSACPRSAGTVYEADDEEADRIYEAVDAAIDERRRAKREARERDAAEKLLKERPTIQSQFADLKRGLADMSENDWHNLRASLSFLCVSAHACASKRSLTGRISLTCTAEVSNLIGNRVKKPRLEGRSYVVPDSILVGARDMNTVEHTLADEQMVRSPPYLAPLPGLSTDLLSHLRRRTASRRPPTP